MLQDYAQISAVVSYPNSSRRIATTSPSTTTKKNQESYPAVASSSSRTASMEEPVVSILWDMENCPVPGDVSADEVAGNIRMAIRVHPAIQGVVTMFSAYGDFNQFPRRLREGCQRTGINLIDVPNGKKDASDKAILVDMFLFALDNPPPCTILLISGDVDFAPALHKLGQRGYGVVLAVPAGAGVSSALCNAGRYVWDWPSVARGEGFVPAKAFLAHAPEERSDGHSRSYNAPTHGISWQSSDDSDTLFEEEHSKCIVGGSSSNRVDEHRVGCSNDGRNKCFAGNGDDRNKCLPVSGDDRNKCLPTSGDDRNKCPTTTTLGDEFNSVDDDGQKPCPSGVSTGCSRIQSFAPAHQKSEASELFLKRKLAFGSSSPSLGSNPNHSVASESNNGEDCATSWVQPGDLEGLKSQLINLLKNNGGELPFVRVPSEYCKLYGRPLFLSEYGSAKLAHLILRMQDALIIKGEGGRKKICLKEGIRVLQRPAAGDNNGGMWNAKKSSVYKEARIPITMPPPVVKDLDMLEEVILLQRKSAREEEELDDGARKDDGNIEAFKRELQELLVSYACKIPLMAFQRLYHQRYCRELDLASLHVDSLEMLFERAKDVASVKEERETRRKYVVARC